MSKNIDWSLVVALAALAVVFAPVIVMGARIWWEAMHFLLTAPWSAVRGI